MGVLAWSSARAIVMAVAVALVLWAMRVKSPAVRHRAWTGVLLVMLLLPAFSLWVPKLAIPLLPPAYGVPTLVPGAATAARVPFLNDWVSSVAKVKSEKLGPVQSPSSTASGKQSRSETCKIILIIYLIGFTACVVKLLAGMILSCRLARPGSENEVCCYSSGLAAPLTAGLFRPRIFLPIESKNWDSHRLSAVLTHEKEHMRRHDPLIGWLGLLNRCIYWFHPLAWWLCGKLSALSEQSCDEVVIAKGHDPGEYVGYLLEFARTVKRSGVLVTYWGSYLHGAHLAQRIRSIVIAGRSPAMSRSRMVLLTALCAGATIVPAIGKLARAQAAAINARATHKPAIIDEMPATMAGASGPLQSSTSGSSDSIFYKTAMDLFQKHEYRKAREAFQSLIKKYPDSSLVPSSYLAVGDTFYCEGGVSNLLTARDQYINFALFFRDQPQAANALNKAMSINRMMRTRSGDHDQASEAESIAGKSARQYPESDHALAMKRYLQELEESLAKVHSDASDQHFQRSGDGHLSEYYRKWLDEDVACIIFEEEREVFLNLKTDEERERFIERFWASRDPNPGSRENYFKEEHYRRSAYVNERFAASSVPGWRTSRGRTYIKYGPPSEIESGPAGGVFDLNGQLDHSMFPYELWRYDQIDSIGEHVIFLFVDPKGTGDYVLSRQISGRWPPWTNHH